jgi:hypothetical protein
LEDELEEEELEDELLEPPTTLRLVSVAVLEPLAQNPKDTLLFEEMFALWLTGVTVLPERLPFHKLLMLLPLGLSATVQLVMLVLPLLRMLTSAQ